MAWVRKLSPLVALLHPPGVPCVLAVFSPRRPALERGNLMQLIGMLDSPYVRRVAIALIMAKTPFIHRPISPISLRSAPALKRFPRLAPRRRWMGRESRRSATAEARPANEVSPAWDAGNAEHVGKVVLTT